MELEQARREVARWRILVILYSGRPGSVDESVILRTINDCELNVTQTELRRELEYLKGRKLIVIKEGPKEWAAHLESCGVDIVEYTVPCRPGIARPEKW